ncbi:hypothetical protein CPC08DRAFT_766785 [Agrocybe pediades]|nr:hypothetical protein CPC08DRAFT_766785 [Agrocybe pediades]
MKKRESRSQGETDEDDNMGYVGRLAQWQAPNSISFRRLGGVRANATVSTPLKVTDSARTMKEKGDIEDDWVIPSLPTPTLGGPPPPPATATRQKAKKEQHAASSLSPFPPSLLNIRR